MSEKGQEFSSGQGKGRVLASAFCNAVGANVFLGFAFVSRQAPLAGL